MLVSTRHLFLRVQLCLLLGFWSLAQGLGLSFQGWRPDIVSVCVADHFEMAEGASLTQAQQNIQPVSSELGMHAS